MTLEIERTKCSKCDSTNLEHYNTHSEGEHGEDYVTSYRKCKKCGYIECMG
ncbi:hypothetical protein LCGC14_2082720 [marine sediment metagenome]|uniref:TFIIS-type domain-containing protein n=1 Tax=marine sediment metagenome TaxID=412755 RepID=A0A0F9GTE8_9ZZZZ